MLFIKEKLIKIQSGKSVNMKSYYQEKKTKWNGRCIRVAFFCTSLNISARFCVYLHCSGFKKKNHAEKLFLSDWMFQFHNILHVVCAEK